MPATHPTAPRLAPLALILALAACDQRTPSGPTPDPDPVPTALRVLEGDGQLATAGAPLPAELVVAAVDADGRPVPGVAVQFVVVAGGGEVAPRAVTTDGDGFARTRWTLGTVAADSQVVEAHVEGLPPSRIRARVRPDAPAALTLSGGGAAGPVGAPLADSLSVAVRDRYGNPVADVEVAWEVAAGGGALSPARSTTRADGTARAQWTLGPRVDSAQVARVRVASLEPAAFTANALTAGVPLQLAKRGGDGQRGSVGSLLEDSLGVVLRMGDGRPVQGVLVFWSATASAGTVTPAVSRTDENGAASATWRLGTLAGLARVAATVDEGTLTFTALAEAGAPARMAVAGGGDEGPVGGALADSLAVRVTDAHGNPVPGAEVAWTAGAGSGAVQPARSTTDAHGVARAQWTLGLREGAPAQSAAARLGTLPPVAFQAMATTRGVPLLLVRTGGDGQTGTVGAVLADSLAVQLRTQAGEPVQGATVAWAVTAGGGAISTVTSRTDAQGRARAAWTLGTSAGPVRASARVKQDTVAFSATARAGAPTALQAAGGSGQSATRGTALDGALVARAVDAHGNPVAGVQVRWSVVAGGGQLEQSTSTTGADGTARTRWAMGYSPGENTAAAAADGITGTARFTGTALAGRLLLSGVAYHPYWDQLGMKWYTIRTRIRLAVVDEEGNYAINPPLTYVVDTQPPYEEVGWDTVTLAVWRSDMYDVRQESVIPPAVVRFENQQVVFDATCPEYVDPNSPWNSPAAIPGSVTFAPPSGVWPPVYGTGCTPPGDPWGGPGT